MPTTPMVAGTLIAGRFVIERVAGHGGMSTVYRALDQPTGRPVALKLLRKSGESLGNSRLVVEAQLLAELRHPGIVSYIAHGQTAKGLPFLAMEWLDGEDLAQRLQRQPLSVQESITLLHCAADALAAAHRYGVVHRDIKPSNLFLRGSRVESVVLLDFGVARHSERSISLTATGAVIGTPEYMAPEQAQGQSQLGPSSDIFSLGCVVFECITGQPPFAGAHLSAQLSRVIFEEAPSIDTLCPDLPGPLVQLVSRMLAKRPEDRQRDGGELLSELVCLEELTLASQRVEQPRGAPPSDLFKKEERLISVVLASSIADEGMAATTIDPDAERSDERLQRAALMQSLTQFGAQVQSLPDDSLLAFLSGSGPACDQALAAVRCAMLIKQRRPHQVVALATGRASTDDHLPSGEAVSRVVEFLQLQPARDTGGGANLHAHVLLDETTAGLIDSYFISRQVATGLYVLTGARDPGELVRPHDGTVPPCVGRDRELRVIEAAVEASIDESFARVILITADAGLGKSRLCHELLGRVRQHHPNLEVLFGRGVPPGSSPAYSMLGQALRTLCGVAASDGRSQLLERLEQRLGRHLPAANRRDTVASLAELCLPTSAVAYSQSADRIHDSGTESDLLLGVLRFLSAELSAHPILFVLEDLHHGDALTVRLLDLALRELTGHPLFVLALGRPTVSRRFPRLWSDHRLDELRLEPLSRSASLALGTHILPTAGPAAHDLVELAGGIPLHLELLFHAMAQGNGTELPGPLLALLQGQVMALPPQARRVLRIASLFGASFPVSGLRALIGCDPELQDLDRWIGLLVDKDFLLPERRDASDGTERYRFRSAPVHEAAHSLLDNRDRTFGHRMAAAYLERERSTPPFAARAS